MEPYDPSKLAPGDVVAQRYEIEEVLGEGGFGAVYRARQLNLGRQVAIKVLHASMASPSGLGRFWREARLAQQLEHPNTVRIFDFGETETGFPYIVFQLLRGRSLEAALEQDGPMPLSRVGRIVSQVLKSLMEAHEAGIVHRDIKPENIYLIDFQGEPDYVKVLDFGVAKTFLTSPEEGTNLTLSGELIGTPNYMSPEQVRAEPVTPATDAYALGLVMAEMLSGRQVFTGPSAISVCFAQSSAAPAPIPKEVLDSPFGPVVARATSKPAAERFQDAAEMLQDLSAAIQTMGEDRVIMSRSTRRGAPRLLAETVPSSPIPGSRGPGAASRRSRATAVVGTLAVAFLALGLAVAGVGIGRWMLDEDPGPAHRVPRPEETLELPSMPPFNAPPGDPNQPAASPPSPNDPPAAASSRLAQLTPELIRQRLESWQWRVLNQSNIGPAGGMRATLFTITNDVHLGGVWLYDFEDIAHARMLVTTQGASGRAVHGESRRVLLVELRRDHGEPVDTSASSALLEGLLQ